MVAVSVHFPYIGKMIIHMNLFQINPKQNLRQAFTSINYIH